MNNIRNTLFWNMYCDNNSHFLLSIQGNKLSFYKEKFKINQYNGTFNWKYNKKLMISDIIVHDNDKTLILNESIRIDKNVPFLMCYYSLNIKQNNILLPCKDILNISNHLRFLLKIKNDTNIKFCSCCKDE